MRVLYVHAYQQLNILGVAERYLEVPMVWERLECNRKSMALDVKSGYDKCVTNGKRNSVVFAGGHGEIHLPSVNYRILPVKGPEPNLLFASTKAQSLGGILSYQCTLTATV